MAKDPAFLFYPGDFNTGTQFFTDDQVGKYMRLLMAQHQHGHLTEEQVIFICKSYDKQVMSKFVKDSAGLWYNERLQIEIEKRKKFVESRSKNKEGKTKQKIISKTYDFHMENENRNENRNELNKGVSKIEIYQSIFSDELFITDLTRLHKGKDLFEAFEECWIHHSSKPNPPTEGWEWRQKLNTWLTFKEVKKENGKNKSANSNQRHTDSLIQGLAERYGTKPG